MIFKMYKLRILFTRWIVFFWNYLFFWISTSINYSFLPRWDIDFNLTIISIFFNNYIASRFLFINFDGRRRLRKLFKISVTIIAKFIEKDTIKPKITYGRGTARPPSILAITLSFARRPIRAGLLDEIIALPILIIKCWSSPYTFQATKRIKLSVSVKDSLIIFSLTKRKINSFVRWSFTFYLWSSSMQCNITDDNSVSSENWRLVPPPRRD